MMFFTPQRFEPDASKSASWNRGAYLSTAVAHCGECHTPVNVPPSGIGAGSTSFEMVRYVGDRFWVIPLPPWAEHRMDPISVRDVLYYLLAAADPERVAAGAYDLVGPTTTTYHRLLGSYVRAAGERRAGIPVYDVVPRGIVGRLAGAAVPVPSGLAADLIESLDHPMTASDTVLGDYVPDPPDGLTSIDDAVAVCMAPSALAVE